MTYFCFRGILRVYGICICRLWWFFVIDFEGGLLIRLNYLFVGIFCDGGWVYDFNCWFDCDDYYFFVDEFYRDCFYQYCVHWDRMLVVFMISMDLIVWMFSWLEYEDLRELIAIISAYLILDGLCKLILVLVWCIYNDYFGLFID